MEVFREVAAAAPAVYGADDDQVHRCRANHGQALASCGRWADAEAVLRAALAGLRASREGEHTAALIAGCTLGQALSAQRKHGEASALVAAVRDAWVAAESAAHAPGDESWRSHLEYLRSKDALAQLALDAGDADAAEALLREALAEHDAALGASHASSATIAFKLGSLLKKDGRVAEAKALLKRAAAGDAVSLGAAHPYTQASAQQAAEAKAEAATCSFPGCAGAGGSAQQVIKRCAGCRAAGYCSPACQKARQKNASCALPHLADA